MPWPVLLIARVLEAGGSERQMREVAKALDRTRFSPHVACFRPQASACRELEAAGVRVVHFPVHSFASLRAISGTFAFARYVRRNGIRLVHAFDYPGAVFAIPSTRFLTSAAAVSSQRSHRDLIPPRYRELIRLTDRLANAIVVNCEFVRHHLEKEERVPPDRIELCYNGIDLDVFHPGETARPNELPLDAFVIGVVCALRPEKGLSTLLHAFARVRHLHPAMKLAIVGDGPMRQPLEAESRSLGIFDQCIFAPATNDVARWLRAIDIFVLPSLSEALSNSLMEAMACGCCVVASSTGGNPELVRDGETGLLFPAGDPTVLGTALQNLIQDSPLRERLAGEGTKFIHERFSIRAAADRMGEIYASLIQLPTR